MSHDTLLAAIDAEIKRLEDARKLLAGAAQSVTIRTSVQKATGSHKRRHLSAEGRARIAAAQKKRWAAKKAAAKKSGKA